jgi:hypothetical protein
VRDKAGKVEFPVEEGTRFKDRRSKGATDVHENHDLSRFSTMAALDLDLHRYVREYFDQDLDWQVGDGGWRHEHRWCVHFSH